MNPGIVGLYWLAAAFIVASAYSATATIAKRAAHRAGRAACRLRRMRTGLTP